MSDRMKNKVSVITGGASGMGLATVELFLQEGGKVVIADLNAETAGKVMTDLAGKGYENSVGFIRVDVSQEDQIEAMIAYAVEKFGRLDVLFNNAGVGGAFGAVTDINVDDWDYTFHVMVRGVFLGIKHGARQMIAQGQGGSMINTASLSGFSGGGGPMAYSVAKAAVLNLTRLAALELAPNRIRVNSICPGSILTPLAHGGKPEETAAMMKPFVPWPEIGMPDDIARAALFYASDDSSYVTGDHMLVDGGMMAAGPGLTVRGGFAATPTGYAGVNRGLTGESTLIRQRPPKQQ